MPTRKRAEARAPAGNLRPNGAIEAPLGKWRAVDQLELSCGVGCATGQRAPGAKVIGDFDAIRSAGGALHVDLQTVIGTEADALDVRARGGRFDHLNRSSGGT